MIDHDEIEKWRACAIAAASRRDEALAQVVVMREAVVDAARVLGTALCRPKDGPFRETIHKAQGRAWLPSPRSTEAAMTDIPMRERIARAICCPHRTCGESSNGCAWRLELAKVNAVVDAMREPTRAMQDAGAFYHIHGAGPATVVEYNLAAAAWRSMIEAVGSKCDD